MNHKELLFGFLRSVVCGGQVTEEMKNACTEETLAQVYKLAAHHDLAHLVGQAISTLPIAESEAAKKCKNAAMVAFYRYTQIQYEYQRICDLLEKEKIPFIPLKGSVLRDYYPEPWMRTSCDIDILVHPEILEQAAKALVEQLGYDRKGKGDHDISLYAATGVHLELHYSAVDEGRMPQAQKVLAGIWEDATPAPGKQYHKCMSDEMFYFYHIAHMAKHFDNGGCGVRPFLDIWILENRVAHDPKKREALLTAGGMAQFARAAQRLTDVWFGRGEMDSLSEKLEKFILDGGVYGTVKGLVAVRQTQKGSKLRYAVSRIFLSYRDLKYQYPILQKHKWLMPVFQVVRWCKLLFCGGVKRSLHEMQVNAVMSPEEIGTTDELIKYLGL